MQGRCSILLKAPWGFCPLYMHTNAASQDTLWRTGVIGGLSVSTPGSTPPNKRPKTTRSQLHPSHELLSRCSPTPCTNLAPHNQTRGLCRTCSTTAPGANLPGPSFVSAKLAINAYYIAGSVHFPVIACRTLQVEQERELHTATPSSRSLAQSHHYIKGYSRPCQSRLGRCSSYVASWSGCEAHAPAPHHAQPIRAHIALALYQ